MPFGGTSLIVLALSAFLCLPPYLALRMFVRSFQRAERRGLPTRKFYFAISATLMAFMFNLGVFIGSAISLQQGTLGFVRLHVVAIAIAWVALWIWIFLGLALGRDLGRRRGLR